MPDLLGVPTMPRKERLDPFVRPPTEVRLRRKAEGLRRPSQGLSWQMRNANAEVQSKLDVLTDVDFGPSREPERAGTLPPLAHHATVSLDP